MRDASRAPRLEHAAVAVIDGYDDADGMRRALQGIETLFFVSAAEDPDRVSLHRAAVGDFVLYSNSPAGLRRALDAHAGRLKRLADADDFR